MARFRGTVDGRSRTTGARLGTDQVMTRANAWGIGVIARAYMVDEQRTLSGRFAVVKGKKQDGRDVVSAGITGGSGNGSVLLELGTFSRDDASGRIMPEDDIARRIFRALGLTVSP